MIRLSREVRFALVDDYDHEIHNSWSGWPSTNKVVPHLTLVCVVEGEADPQTGYVCNIQEIDKRMRNVVTEEIIPEFDSSSSAEKMIQKIFECCRRDWQSKAGIVEMTLLLSPFLKFMIRAENENMICLTQQFEFSAAHRLHCPELSEDENKDLFGKCNNPDGHGHNYVVEISIEGECVEQHGEVIDLPQFEATVKKLVVDRLDHKHLNINVDYFAKRNPSVENIAMAIWNWLDGQFGDANLANVRVYETPKTWADYGGHS